MWKNLMINKSLSNLITFNNYEILKVKTKNNNVCIINDSKNEKKYILYLVISKNKLNEENIKIIIDNKEKHIKHLEYISFYNETYYKIEENIINKNSLIKKHFNLSITNELIENINEDKSINFQFKIDEI